jgi:hypothetical protein
MENTVAKAEHTARATPDAILLIKARQDGKAYYGRGIPLLKVPRAMIPLTNVAP